MNRPMKLKSYFSGTVEAAMELARRELGEEAWLMNARQATPETRYLGSYEVVFGMPASEAAPSQNASNSKGVDQLSRDVEDLRREFARLTRSLRNSGPLEPQTCSVDASL